MSNAARYNVLPLLSVKPGLERSLEQVQQDLRRYFGSPATGSEALHKAQAEMHRVSGVLRMISLDGVMTLSGEIEKLLEELAKGVLSPIPAHQDITQRALLSLMQYLDALADGASNAALRLFPQYQELQQARGIEMAFEVDMFFPELHVELPPDILKVPLEADAQSAIKAARSQYQQALLKWLRQENPVEALQLMRTAVLSVMDCVAPDHRRAFWWIAAGLFDCLIFEGLPPELSARSLFSRIDRQMKLLLEGNRQETHAIECEMLYLVARSHAVSEMVEGIKRVYALDEYLPEEPLLPPSETGLVLDKMRTLLAEMRETWEKCSQDDGVQGCSSLAEQSRQLHSLSEQLDRNTLQFLSNQICTIAALADDPERGSRIAQDMAMALLLLESGIDQYTHLGSNYHDQARILCQRLQAGMMRLPDDKGKFAEIVALHFRMEERWLMLPLTSEMLGNLQHVEQELNAFFGDPDKRDGLADLGRLLHQVLAAMHLLSLDEAELLLRELQLAAGRYVAGDKPAAIEMQAVAIALSATQAYVQNLAHGQKPDVAPLDLALQGMSSARQPPSVAYAGQVQPAAPQQEAAVASVAQGKVAQDELEDEGLLEVFLEEAQEVLGMLRTNLGVSHLHSDSREPLVIIRRGFHTLKGSSRMVGLAAFGEVAWAAERAMNKWLETNKPATPGLLKFIEDAGGIFQVWVDALGKSGAGAPDCAALLLVAQQIESGNEILRKEPLATPEATEALDFSVPQAATPRHVAPQVTIPEPASLEFTEPNSAAPEEGVPPESEVVISETVSMSPTLFHISTEEAAQHVSALEQQIAALRSGELPVIGYDFMRAAHTLAGVNRTMGFVQMADLAYALEQWLQARMDKPIALNEQQLVLLEKVIAALHDMSLQVSGRHNPEARPELVSQLQADKGISLEQVKSPQAGSVLDQQVEAAADKLSPQTIEKPQVIAKLEVGSTSVVEMPPSSAPADRLHPSSPVVEARQVQDDMDENLLPIYLEEANDLYVETGSNLRSWRRQPLAAEFGHNLQRGLHTMKGGARMVGAMRLGELIHRMEDHVVQAATQRDSAFWDELENYFDRIGGAIERLRSKPVEDAKAAIKPELNAAAPEIAAQILGQPALDAGAGQVAADTGAERISPVAMLRVRSDTIDLLVNEAGEISVARSRAEVEMRSFKTSLLELTGNIERLRKQLREIEIQAEGQMQARETISNETEEKFDPLEFDRFTQFQDLTRSMNESVHDVRTVQHALLKNLDETTTALLTQSFLIRELQQRLMTIRMVPFSAISERLYRVVRQTSRELGKKANLELHGSEVELDRSMLEKMTAPFEHLLRNAIAHGLESEGGRKEKDKSPIGTIRLSVKQENNEVNFEFSDDGAGLDIDRLRDAAIEQGILRQGEQASESQIMQLVFSSGLSTASQVTEIAGRGVGMDVVRSEIVELGGHIDVFSERGKGVRFAIRLPLTLAVAQILMVESGHEMYAIHSGMVEQVLQVKHADLVENYNKGQVEWSGNNYSLHSLARLLGGEGQRLESRQYNPVLLLRSGERRLAVHVDDLAGNQEVVVKNIGPQLARLPGIAGATVMGNGKVVLILNPIALEQRASVAYKVGRATTAETIQAKPLIMVVDDSLTVRKVTSRMLIRAGYQVVTAKDGQDALEKLTEFTPAVVLLDIEMPRMDGFELTKRLRGDPKTRYLPIIIITSREAEKHRLYAQELGVNAYLGKPYQEEELLDHIKFYQEEELQQHNKFHEPDTLLKHIASFVSPSTEG